MSEVSQYHVSYLGEIIMINSLYYPTRITFSMTSSNILVQLNHIFVRGKILGVESRDIEENLVIPLSRPYTEVDKFIEKEGSLMRTVSPNQMPSNTFFNNINTTTNSLNLLESMNIKKFGLASRIKRSDMPGHSTGELSSSGASSFQFKNTLTREDNGNQSQANPFLDSSNLQLKGSVKLLIVSY